MNKIYRVLGKRGRITIPLDIRNDVGISSDDILSFSVQDNQIVITKEKICNNCRTSMQEIADNLTSQEKQEMLKYLMRAHRSGKLK